MDNALRVLKDIYPSGIQFLEKTLFSFFRDHNCSENFYFGIFDNDKLIGACTFSKNNPQNFEANSVYQLSEIIVDENYRGKNLRWNLLVHAEAYLKSMNSILIWCNAQVSTISFYERSGYQSKGSEFEIPNVGLHKVMYKLL